MNPKRLTGKSAGSHMTKLIEESTRIDLAVAWSGENAVVDALIQHQEDCSRSVRYSLVSNRSESPAQIPGLRSRPIFSVDGGYKPTR